jgi:ParB family transcriptional regulator, chromosome partitioning protein
MIQAERGPITHHLKTWIKPYRELASGDKTFEFRINDRDFRVGDFLVLQEYSLIDGLTGEEVTVEVTSILHGPEFGVPGGYCCMSILRTEEN